MNLKRRSSAAVVLAALVLATPTTAGRVRTGSLSGEVTRADGKPAAGARVILQASDGRAPRTRLADKKGRFLFSSLRPGLYDLRAQAKGLWSEWTHNVVVRAGQQAHVKLSLTAADPPAPDARQAAAELRGRVREWTVPVADSLPHDPAVDPQGNVWLTLMRANQLARLNPETGEWKLFPAPTPNSGPHGLVADKDGNIWFTENSAGKIGRVDARSGEVTEYAAPTAKDPHTPIFAPDGTLWFTAQRSNVVVRMDIRMGTMREFAVPTPNARPYGIVIGPDGALWFCEFGVNKLGRIDPENGKITEYEIPFADARPRRLWAFKAPHPAIYYTDFRRGRLGRFDIGQMSFKEWPSPSGDGSEPYGIAADSDGYLWYAEFSANQLVRFDPQKESFERFTLPSPGSGVRHMARDPRGRIWMALSGANKAAVVE